MLDRAPMLLGSSRNFGDVSTDSDRVGTVNAVEPLQRIQVSQSTTVKHDACFSVDFRNSIDGETDGLIHGHKQIKRHERNNAWNASIRCSKCSLVWFTLVTFLPDRSRRESLSVVLARSALDNGLPKQRDMPWCQDDGRGGPRSQYRAPP